MLDQGANHRVKVGQIVLAQSDSPSDSSQLSRMCVVGRICQVGPLSSHLQLITDPELKLPVFIEPVDLSDGPAWRAQGVLGVAKGSSMQDVEVVVTMVSGRDRRIQIGDAVLACSDADHLPVPRLAGYVKTCKPNDRNPLHWEFTVAPAVDLHALREVTIVQMNQDLESKGYK